MADRFGKYKLDTRLAVGGMAEVFLARQTGPAGFEKQLVVKRILPQFAGDESFVEMFLDEGRLAAQLAHPNIVQIFELGEAEGSYYIAMEHIHGESLADLMDRAVELRVSFPHHYVARIVASVCAGLDYVHHFADVRGNPLGLVHRDVSPDNVLVSYNGAVKMIDFGVAKAITNRTKTQSGTVKGKFCYMSPEQIMGQEIDGRADVFGVGILLYEATTGTKPFGDDNGLLTVSAIINDTPRSPRSLRPDYPVELEAIVLKALEKDPERRYARAREMQRDLEHFIQTHASYVGSSELGGLVRRLRRGDREDLDWIRALHADLHRPAPPRQMAPRPPTTRGASPAARVPSAPAPSPLGRGGRAGSRLDQAVIKDAGRRGGVGVATGHLAHMGTPAVPLRRSLLRRHRATALRAWILVSLGVVLVALAAWLASRVDTLGVPRAARHSRERIATVPARPAARAVEGAQTEPQLPADPGRPDDKELGRRPAEVAGAPSVERVAPTRSSPTGVPGGSATVVGRGAPDGAEADARAERLDEAPPGDGGSAATSGATSEPESGGGSLPDLVSEDLTDQGRPAPLPAAARRTAGGAIRGSGTVVIESNVVGASVFEGRRLLGKTPLRYVLVEGRHDLEVRWFHDAKPLVVDLPYDGTRRAVVRFVTAQLVLQGVPAGVRCEIDGRPLARREHEGLTLPPGEYGLRCLDRRRRTVYERSLDVQPSSRAVVPYGG